MRTVREFILSNELRWAKDRLEKLIELSAPEVMIDAQVKFVAELETGNLKVGGDNSLMDEVFDTFIVKQGRGGKRYVEFDNGVRYFPNAKYGKFISR